MEIFPPINIVSSQGYMADYKYSSDLFIDSDFNSKIPIPILEQYQYVELIARVHYGSLNRISIKLLWDDDYGKDSVKVRTPTVA
ncbi:MAG: hypothetical protein GY714_12010 [Desulfobacterales bacterium]|nr:hypothetical protein [Desulfobacterales bacterium]